MKKLFNLASILILLAGFAPAAVYAQTNPNTNFSIDANSTIDPNGVTLGCLWGPSCSQVNSLLPDEAPLPEDIASFGTSVYLTCTGQGYSTGQCSVEEDKAVAAANAYNSCPSDVDQSACATSAQSAADAVTPPAPAAATQPPAATPAPSTVGGTVAGCYDNGGSGTFIGQLPSSGGCPAGSQYLSGNGSLTYVPLEPLPFASPNGISDVGGLLNQALHLLVIAGAFLAVGAIVFAGVEYMFTDVVHTKSTARARAKNALWGLLLLLGAYLILNTINPQLLNFSNIFCPTTGIPGGGCSTSTTPITTNSTTPLSASDIQAQQQACASGGAVFNSASGTCVSPVPPT